MSGNSIANNEKIQLLKSVLLNKEFSRHIVSLILKLPLYIIITI